MRETETTDIIKEEFLKVFNKWKETKQELNQIKSYGITFEKKDSEMER